VQVKFTKDVNPELITFELENNANHVGLKVNVEDAIAPLNNVAPVDGELITLAQFWAKELAISSENDYDDINEQDLNSSNFEGNKFNFLPHNDSP
jgi:hypothetical protein